MRFVLFSLIAGCAVTPEPVEPTPPVPEVEQGPMQTPSVDVLASSFDAYCTRDDECAAVYEGNACDSCQCANTAIRRDALPEYRAELGAYWSCQDDGACACERDIGDAALCVAGRCTLSSP
jgi:hypothetical protein